MKTVAYHGIKGAFSYLTALKGFGEDSHLIGLQTFKGVFEAVEQGKADYAVIPIENSLIGSIYENYDLLNLYEMKIIGEHYTKIEHCLLTLHAPHEQAYERLKRIKQVLSHPKAIEQCISFFHKHPWIEAVAFRDTATAAAEVASRNDPSLAAIASASAATLYGLEIIKKGIEDDPNNYTRFVSLTKKKIEGNQNDKCSLIWQLKHVPGALAELLSRFANESINLTKIESRPLRVGFHEERGLQLQSSLFEYLFYVDFEFTGKKQQTIEDLLKKVCSKVQKLKILGFYKKGILWKG